MNTRKILLGLIILAATARAASAGDHAKRFSFAPAVPADSWLYVHFAHNDERDFFSKHWGTVWNAFCDAHFEQDLKRMLQADMAEEDILADAYFSSKPPPKKIIYWINII